MRKYRYLYNKQQLRRRTWPTIQYSLLPLLRRVLPIRWQVLAGYGAGGAAHGKLPGLYIGRGALGVISPTAPLEQHEVPPLADAAREDLAAILRRGQLSKQACKALKALTFKPDTPISSVIFSSAL